jgi:hypothetical protein
VHLLNPDQIRNVSANQKEQIIRKDHLQLIEDLKKAEQPLPRPRL